MEELAKAAVFNRRALDPEDRLSDLRYILELLGSLTTVQGYEGSEFVALTHFSVKEYLISSKIPRTSVLHFAMNERDTHSLLAESCL